MPGGALGPGFPPQALPLPKNPEEYRKITKYTEESRKIPKIPGEMGKIRPAGQCFRNPGDDPET